MNNALATPQIYLTGRIINAVGFDSNELYIKYQVIMGSNFKKIDGVLQGDSFQSLSLEQDEVNVVNFDQPLYFNLSCKSIKGWPKILVEVWVVSCCTCAVIDGRLKGLYLSSKTIWVGAVALCNCA